MLTYPTKSAALLSIKLEFTPAMAALHIAVKATYGGVWSGRWVVVMRST